ncbi:MAG: penicillin-binding protein [Candidatus Marinimicrobia bacterium]|nr:penicillin-binding protein [Candidatus Neomarinimicrobiota bacterium]
MIRVVRPSSRKPFLYPGEEVKPQRELKVRIQGTSACAVETGRMRLIVTSSLFGLAFIMIGVRLLDLMVLDAGSNQTVAGTVSVDAPPPFNRANIVDRNGVVIATNVPTVNLYADSKLILSAKEAADKLIAILPDLVYGDVMKRLSSGQRFIYLRRNLTPTEQMAVNRLGIPGVYFEDSESRVYPQGALFAHVLGNTDPDNHGIAGVERTFDDVLKSSRNPIALSLDARVQHATREALAAGVSKFNAKSGSGVVMDVSNGEILALVSLPDYDPKSMGQAAPDTRFNRATLGLYEMGSTFKLFTAATALETGSARLDSFYDAREPITVGRYIINDFRGKKRWLSVPEILIHSSNIGAAKIALEYGAEIQQEFLTKFGLMSPLNLELPEVGSPNFAAVWRKSNTMNAAFGYGISVTPVHVASAVSALVNGGTFYPPTIVRRTKKTEIPGRRVVSEDTSTTMRALMRLIVLEGSKKADVKGYFVGGKTGSAEKVSSEGVYSQSARRTSFVAAFPIDRPRYAVMVMLDEPQGIKETFNFTTAGWNAAPTASNIIESIAPLLGIYPFDHSDDFQPLSTLVHIYGGGKHPDTQNRHTNLTMRGEAPNFKAADFDLPPQTAFLDRGANDSSDSIDALEKKGVGGSGVSQ